MKNLIRFGRNCVEHPKSVGQTYLQHFMFSASFALRLAAAAFTAIMHALIPGLFESTTSKAINSLHARMQRQHQSRSTSKRGTKLS